MNYNCRIVCKMSVNGCVSGLRYKLNKGDVLFVQSQSIDKLKWFIHIPSIGKFDWIEKFYFDFLIDRYVTYPNYFGEFQLPVISDNIQSYTCIQPSGFVTWITKDNTVVVGSYNETQKIDCDEIRFR